MSHSAAQDFAGNTPAEPIVGLTVTVRETGETGTITKHNGRGDVEVDIYPYQRSMHVSSLVYRPTN